MNLKSIFGLLKETFHDWSEDKASRLSASLAYFTMFSIAPLLVIAIAIAGLVFGREAATNQIMAQLQGLVGQQSAQMIQTMVQSTSKPSTSILATIIGIITLLLGASGAFGALQDALNTIWGVAPNPRAGLRVMIRDRFVSFGMILVVGFMLLVSLVLTAALAAIGKFMGGLFPGSAAVAQLINFVISFIVITVLFAAIYKVLPDAKIGWSDVWIGAAATSLLFSIGRLLIGLYLGRGTVGSAYGAAGSLVVILVWIYYSAMILFLGAEFTKVYAYKYGSRIEPAETAVPVTEEARAEQGIPTQQQREKAASEQEGRGRRGEPVEAPARAQEAEPARPTGAGATATRAQTDTSASDTGGAPPREVVARRPGAPERPVFSEPPRQQRAPGLAPYLLSAATVILAMLAFAVRRRP